MTLPKARWAGCYDDSWKGLIVDEAFAHPAKMSRGLVRRIFDYLDLPPGSVVCDPFGGIGATGIEAASRGLRAILCELEPKFVELANRNFALHRVMWERCGDPLPVIVQGDSRQLREHVHGLLEVETNRRGDRSVCSAPGVAGERTGGSVAAIVSSPPYSGNEKSDYRVEDENGLDRDERRGMRQGKGGFRGSENYGQTPGQLGGMPAGSVDAVVSSPPYGDSGQSTDGEFVMDSTDVNPTPRKADTRTYFPAEASADGQLGNMPMADAVVSSPPYEGSLATNVHTIRDIPGISQHSHRKDGQLFPSEIKQEYGDADGQLGKETGETFWTAAAEIVAECHAILKPGGLAIWVCKDFVRKGQRVPFSRDWATLCESQGFELVEWIQASLVKETRNRGLFEDEVSEKKERKSFFRRLAEKNGSPPIDHEDVLIMRALCVRR